MEVRRNRLARSVPMVLVILATASYGHAASQPSEGQDPSRQEIEDPPYSVRVGNQSECCPKVLELRVEKTGWDKEKTLEMTGRMQNLEKLRPVVKPRLLVVGTLRYGGTNLWIANLETLIQEAEVWTYGYGVSPSGRWLAYQTHYPRLGVPLDTRRSIVLLYDLSLPPDGNAHGPLSGRPEGESNPGTPIFPRENAERRSWRIMEATDEYDVSSPFLWSDDEKVLVFVAMKFDENPDHRKSFVVRVDLTEAGTVSSFLQQPLTLDNLDARRATAPLSKLAESPILVNLETLSWEEGEEGKWVVGQPALPGDPLGTKVWIRVPGLSSSR